MIYVHTLRSEYKKERQIEFVSVEWECAQIQTKRRQVQKIVTSSSDQDDNHTSYLRKKDNLRCEFNFTIKHY